VTPPAPRRTAAPPRQSGTAPRRRRPAPDAARRVAYDLLRAVDERDAYANLALPALLRERRLDTRDAAFATELAFGALRGRGTYDAVLAACVDRPLAKLDPPVLDVLRLGAHQLLAMRVPSHAAVSATVELARAVLGEGRSTLVNAVLRKVAAQPLDAWLDEVTAASDPLGVLAVGTSHPRWVVAAVRDALGGDLDQTRAALEADNVAPAVHLVARPGRSTVAELVEAGAAPGRWSPYAAVLAGGDPADVPAVAAGRAGVQDEGSQLVALALVAAPVEGRDELWLDACSGPGGKATLLAGLGAARGARLVAAELQPHRARIVARGLSDAVPTTAAVVIADGTAAPWLEGSFDRVLVDAPCTGLGALRRRPESRWRRGPRDVSRLSVLQRSLLEAAVSATRVGGVVAYVTCSPHPDETRRVVEHVLRGGDVEPVDARPHLPAMPDLGDGPDVQLWPHLHGTDAMYLALLRRTG
jgi:16S rRNA (cytosine967-C5)-methyltransferase